MDADNGRDNRVSDFALIRKWSSHVSSLVLTLDGAIPSGSSHLLNQVTVASSAMLAILNLSERRVDAVKSGSLRCADEFKQQENKSSENVRRQANVLS